MENQVHITDVTLHCQSNGNYEKLQCQSGICWCAVPETGDIILGTRAVPETMWTFLPCCKYKWNNIPIFNNKELPTPTFSMMSVILMAQQIEFYEYNYFFVSLLFEFHYVGTGLLFKHFMGFFFSSTHR